MLPLQIIFHFIMKRTILPWAFQQPLYLHSKINQTHKKGCDALFKAQFLS